MDIINPYIHGGESVAFDGFGNRSRSFDGVDDYIDLGDSDGFSFGDGSGNDDPFSISVWVKLADMTGSNKTIIGKLNSATDGEYLLFYNVSNSEFRFSIYDGSQPAWIRARSSVTINENEWYHVAVTYDGSKVRTGIKMYINGSLDTLNDGTGIYLGLENTTATLKIGLYDGLNYTDGNIADVRFYDTDLTATDISDIYNGTNITTNLAGHWLTDADNLLDNAGSNNGTNYGSKYSYDNPSPPVEFGSASRSFDGVSDYITVQDGSWIPTGAQTHSCWIKPRNTIAGGQDILGQWGNTGNLSFLLFYISNQLRAYISGDGTSSVYTGAYGLQPSRDAWHHIAFVFVPSTSLTLYVGGTQVIQITSGIPASLYDSTADFRVGKMDRSYNAPFYGNVADVRMYDTDLSSTEITDLYTGADVQTNLIGHWLTDNDDLEDKVGVNDGTNFGSTYSYDNPPMDLIPSRQASRSFDGVNNRIDLADQTSTIGTAFSITVWAKLETLDTADGECIVDMADSAVGFTSYIARIFYYGVTGDLEFAVRDAAGNRNVVAVSGFSDTGWVHLAFVRNGSTVEGYVNGVSVGTDSSSTIGAHTASHYFTIGALRNAGATQGIYNTSGKICDVRLYDNVLTSTDIANIYNGITDRTNLVGQWLTNSDDVLDHAGNNDGTNFGSTYSTDSPS